MRKGDRERERERENARESESERESGTNKIETERRDLLSTNSTLMMCDLCDVVFVIQKTRMSFKRPTSSRLSPLASRHSLASHTRTVPGSYVF